MSCEAACLAAQRRGQQLAHLSAALVSCSLMSVHPSLSWNIFGGTETRFFTFDIKSTFLFRSEES